MPPGTGDPAPPFEAMLCTDDTFRTVTDKELLADGAVFVFFGFAFSAIAENWWSRYDAAGWDEFDVPVVGVCRDGPYALNAFIRSLESPFAMVSDPNGAVISAFDVGVERDGMAGVTTARRAIFVIDPDGIVQYRWLGDDWISPVPREEVEAAVEEFD